MISLLVDECYAFDYLCILEIKKNINEEKNVRSWKECFDYLKLQLKEKFDLVISSEEYNELYHANLLTFDRVEKVRTGKQISAKEIDDANMLRYEKKVNLQKKFFPNNELREIKT